MTDRFRYVWAIKDAFLSSGITNLQNLDGRGWIAGSDANIFVANHDTERVSRTYEIPLFRLYESMSDSLAREEIL